MQRNFGIRQIGLLLLCIGIRTALAAPQLPLPKGQLAVAQRDEKTLGAVEITAARPKSGLKAQARTATRLKLTLLETPASVTIIDQVKLRARGETTAIEALENAPGVAPSYIFGVLALSGRGFSGVFNSPTLFDGIRYPGFQVTPRLTLNYEHIEVLGGPAALSAGQGSIAGTVNLVPRLADGVEAQSAYLSIGRFGTGTQAYGIGGSVADSAVNYRMDISHQSSDQRGSFGYAKDTSFEFFHVNTDLAAALGEDINVGLSLEAFRDRAEGYFGSPLSNGRLDFSLRDRNFNVTDDAVDMDVRWARARIEWQPSDTLSVRTMLYVNSENRLFRNAEAYSYTATTNSVARGDFLHITHDQQLSGGYAELSWQHVLFGQEHQLVTGIQLDRNEHDRNTNSPFRFSDRVLLADFNAGSFRSIDAFGLRTATNIEQRSAFAESRLELGAFKLITGFRFDASDVDSFNAVSRVVFQKNYAARSGRAALSYQPSAEASLYLSYATSSEPPAQITTLGLANAAFDLTKGKQLELGYKQQFQTGEVSVALYDLRRTNILSRDPNNANALIQVGEQGARGIELSGRFDFNESLWLDGNAALLNAEFRRFTERVGTTLISRAGNLPADVPERLVSAWLNYRPIPQATVALGLRGVGKRAGNTSNTVFLPGYTTFDLNASFDGDWGRFGARVRNISDRIYASRSYNGASQFLIGEPRWFELSWQRQF